MEIVIKGISNNKRSPKGASPTSRYEVYASAHHKIIIPYTLSSRKALGPLGNYHHFLLY